MSDIGTNFCDRCGERLVNGRCPSCDNNTRENGSLRGKNIPSLFANPDEKTVCVLGNNFLQNFLTSGTLGNGFAVVSDKRVYFKGHMFNLRGENKFVETKESKVVDLKDVTGTGIVTYQNKGIFTGGLLLLIFSIICFIVGIAAGSSSFGGVMLFFFFLLFIPGGTMFTLYFLKRKTLLKIEFAGGCIAFNVKLYNNAECESFQKNLRIAKDKADERASSMTINAMQSAMSNITANQQNNSSGAADELMKYGELLQKGLINESEYAEAKARILGSNK